MNEPLKSDPARELQRDDRTCPDCGEQLQLADVRDDSKPDQGWQYVRCSNPKCGHSERPD